MSTYISYDTEIALDIPDVEELINNVVEAALDHEGCPFEAEVNVTVSDDAEVHRINLEFRGIDKTTDVLSFPALVFETPGEFLQFGDDKDDGVFDGGEFNPDTGELILGDMIISAGKVKAQAQEYGHSERRELAFLVAHSMFHLCGYDHEDPEEAKVMEAKQEAVLEKLGIGRD